MSARKRRNVTLRLFISYPGMYRLSPLARQIKVRCMNTQHVKQLHEALASVREAVNSLTLSGCDKDDVFELMDRVDAELTSARPNDQTLSTFLNSIARSLRNDAKAREVCIKLEDAMRQSGLPSSWQSGI